MEGRGGGADTAEAFSAAQVLERHVEFMMHFYEHIAACPPHGPFRFYSALTFVERMRRHYGLDEAGGALPSSTAKENHKSSSTHTIPGSSGASAAAAAMESPPPQRREGAEEEADDGGVCGAPSPALVRALTIQNVLVLMEKLYNTEHLCNWPLLYVPAEIHVTDVDAVAEAQSKRNQGA